MVLPQNDVLLGDHACIKVLLETLDDGIGHEQRSGQGFMKSPMIFQIEGQTVIGCLNTNGASTR
jgi:hypothetical protein